MCTVLSEMDMPRTLGRGADHCFFKTASFRGCSGTALARACQDHHLAGCDNRQLFMDAIAVIRWRQAHELREARGERSEARPTHRHADFSHGEVTPTQESLCPLNPPGHQDRKSTRLNS